MGCYCIVEEELVGQFQVYDGLKINSKTHCQFIELEAV